MRRAAALAIAVAVAAGCVAWQPQAELPSPGAAAPPLQPRALVQAPAASAAAMTAGSPASVPGGPGTLPASLQGTEADGAWRADAQGHLVVDRALRRRLDYWLSTVGEWSPEVIGARLMAAAALDLPATAVQELQALWDRYLALQRHPWQRVVLPADPATWRPALEERQSVRRTQLGRAAADAFYGDEEQRLWRDVLAWEGGEARPAETPVAVPEHPQAAQRVAEVEAQWARWEARLAEARAEWARLQASAGLSPPQREAAWQGWLASRFDARERQRVQALVAAGPSPG